MISQEQVTEFSQRLGIDEFTIIREYIQIIFLQTLYSFKESRKIYFKGGTAIHLLLPSGRFSEDLDFTGEITIDELDQLLQKVLKKMNLVISDIVLKKPNKGQKSYSGILSYQSVNLKYPLNIHLKFSTREKPETSENSVLATDFPVITPPVIRHLGWSEILAEKIRALFLRAKGRDIYDIWLLLSKGIELDWNMVNRKLEFYKREVSFDAFLKKISAFDDKQLRQDLQRFLPAYDRNLPDRLKDLVLEQLFSREKFSIVRSKNLGYTTMPGGSFSSGDILTYDLKQTVVLDIKRQRQNTLSVKIRNTEGTERKGLVMARNRNGEAELDVIEKNKGSFMNQKSYHDLLQHGFTRL